MVQNHGKPVLTWMTSYDQAMIPMGDQLVRPRLARSPYASGGMFWAMTSVIEDAARGSEVVASRGKLSESGRRLAESATDEGSSGTLDAYVRRDDRNSDGDAASLDPKREDVGRVENDLATKHVLLKIQYRIQLYLNPENIPLRGRPESETCKPYTKAKRSQGHFESTRSLS
jgi:hypothetical protein